MKKFSNIICAVLIIIGAVVALAYGTYEKPNEIKEKYENGGFMVDENGNKQYVQYYDFGQTERKAKEQKILAGAGFAVYTIAVLGGRYFIELRSKIKSEIKKMENENGDDFLS